MSHPDPWTCTATSIGHVGRHARIHIDEVIRPDGSHGKYDWVEMSDQVRVAALVDNKILLIEQHHYLVGRTLQLPGGQIERNETDQEAARRELGEETGYRGGVWQRFGAVYPLPGLTTAQVHLWQARDLTAGPPEPEPYESDLEVRSMSVEAAVSAVRTGAIACAASATLILALAAAGCRSAGS
jgi:ADP-ribose pyrophosphatase